MELKIGDSRTWQPFKIKRVPKKVQEAEQASLIKRVFKHLGFKPKPNDPPTTTMKEITIIVPCLIKGKPRKRGDVVQVEDLKALELVGMKVAELKGNVEVQPKPWERPRLKAVDDQEKETEQQKKPALK